MNHKHMAPTPIAKVKNACPRASKNISGVNCADLKSNKNEML